MAACWQQQLFSVYALFFLFTEFFALTVSYKIPHGLLPDVESGENELRIDEDTSWPGLSYLGQVSAVAFDKAGQLHVFHRGPRIWEEGTFDENNQLRNRDDGPIANDTILVVSPHDGKVQKSWGADRFYMPHGIFIDDKNNTWVTDVGLHQVMKFTPNNGEPTLTLGEAFSPGDGPRHFCMPSDVAVLNSGYFFVSDGYCNSRILMFSPGGRPIKEIGAEDGMRVPHRLSLMPDYGAICVADRENRRILCYSIGTDGNEVGVPLAEFEGRGLSRVFAIDRRGDQMLAVNGPDGEYFPAGSHGVTIDIDTGRFGSLWGPAKGFSAPHGMAVSPDGNTVFVSQLDTTAPKRVLKFDISD